MKFNTSNFWFGIKVCVKKKENRMGSLWTSQFKVIPPFNLSLGAKNELSLYESSMIDNSIKSLASAREPKEIEREWEESSTFLSALQSLSRSGMQGSSKLFQSGQKFVPVIKAHEYSMGLSTTVTIVSLSLSFLLYPKSHCSSKEGHWGRIFR